MDLHWLKVAQWEGRKGLAHGFLGRRGGRSRGAYGSLNLSLRVGDDPRLVKDNLCDAKKALGLHDERIVTMRQVHGDHIIDVEDRRLKEAGEADGLVTQEKGLLLGILTADCVPILFAIPGRSLSAAVHAGWRGALAGMAFKMVRHLGDRYGVEPGAIEVGLGPAIGPCCFEVRPDVSVPLVQKWGGVAENCLQTRNGKEFLDLRMMSRLILEKAGVPSGQIFTVGPCTSCAADEFFSYRRDGAAPTRRETGRQLSFVGWL